MPQDAFTLRFLCEELDALFAGGKINRIVQPSSDELIFTVYTGKRTEKLLIDVNPACPRIGVCEGEKESPLTAPNFCMLLRKHLLNAEINGISLVGYDRIVKIDITPSSEFFEQEKKTLFVELMGRYSNVILTENGKVLGGNRGINCFDNGVRPLIVGHEYRFPPVGEKKLPNDSGLSKAFDGKNKNELPALITSSVQGVAPSTAEELVREYFENKPAVNEADDDEKRITDGEDFYEFLKTFLYSHEKSPCVLFFGGEAKDVAVFPYKCLGSDEIKRFDSLLEAESFYYKERGRIKTFAALKERLVSVTAAALKKAQKRCNAVLAREKDAVTLEENRIKGELILANIYKFKGGESETELLNYYDGTDLKITLDKNLSAAANAERYYKKYNKQKRALAALAPEKERAEGDIEYLKSVQSFIEVAETADDLNAVKEELISAGLLKERTPANPQKKKTVEKKLGREYVIEGFAVCAGRNNLENDALVYGAKGEDIWLHAKDYHSSHVIISASGKEVPARVIKVAAEICAYYSQGKGGGTVEIAYTKRRFLKKPPKAKAGFFVYSAYNTLSVEPNNHEKKLKTGEKSVK